MHTVVFGASGRVGQQVVALALQKGYTVTAFVHSNNPFEQNPHLTVAKGDITDAAAVASALAGSDAVISTLGSWGTKDKNILTSGMQTIIPAMEQQGITRIITLTGSAALWSGDKPTTIDRLNHALLKTVAPKILQDGETHLRLLEASDLAWTSIRSPAMTGQDKAGYRLSVRTGSPLAHIPRAAVAASIIDQIDATDFLRQAPVIHNAR